MSNKEIDIDNPLEGDDTGKWGVVPSFYDKTGLASKSRFNRRVHAAIVGVELIDKIILHEFSINIHLKRDVTDPAKDHYRSIDGKGREEFVEISREEEKEKKNLLQKLAGV